jgi:hypothetical protein
VWQTPVFLFACYLQAVLCGLGAASGALEGGRFHFGRTNWSNSSMKSVEALFAAPAAQKQMAGRGPGHRISADHSRVSGNPVSS